MTSPEPTPDDDYDNQEQPPEEDSALVPAMLIAYAAYRTYRGAHNRTPSGWRQVALALGLQGLIGAALTLVAVRALDWQQKQAGRTGDELWPNMDEGITAGVNAGLQRVAEALIWTDDQVPDGAAPKTKDDNSSGAPAVLPTASNPPALLAQMTTTAVANAAIFAAANAAGWVKKTWRSQEDSRVRDTHRVLNGTTIATAATFVSPSGAKLRFPGDPRAPLSEVANCRCWIRMSRR